MEEDEEGWLHDVKNLMINSKSDEKLDYDAYLQLEVGEEDYVFLSSFVEQKSILCKWVMVWVRL